MRFVTVKRVEQQDIQATHRDGRQVEPASAKPVNVGVLKVRTSDWELTRE